MTIAVAASGFTQDDAVALGHLLYPFDAELGAEIEGSDLIICRGPLSHSKPTISVPTDTKSLKGYQKLTNCGNGISYLPFDPVVECKRKLQSALNPKLAFTYRLFTQFPFQYNIVPSSIRNRLLRMHRIDTNLGHHLAFEICRKILIDAFDRLGFRLQRKTPPSLVVTHDVDTERGLRRVLALKRTEDDLNVESTWFLPSDEYHISADMARDLASSMIGSHDTKHDGKLVQIQRHEELVRRLKESRQKLEGIFGRSIIRFRSPLLQFNHAIVAALKESGYRFDFSAPCWEPVHAPTMSGFGVESLLPFEIDGIVEFPLTLFQDHQVLNVLGMSPREAMKFWIEQAKLVRSFEGDIVILIHPDYSFAQDLQAYRCLLGSLLEIDHSLESFH